MTVDFFQPLWNLLVLREVLMICVSSTFSGFSVNFQCTNQTIKLHLPKTSTSPGPNLLASGLRPVDNVAECVYMYRDL